jgi:hypothetical protein
VIYRLWQSGLLRCAAVAVFLLAARSAESVSDLLVRAENFTVPPATGPLAHVLVRNPTDAECTVTVEPKFPEGWQWAPERRSVTVAAGQSKRVPFKIEKATDVESNRYPVDLTILEDNVKTVYSRDVVCASAPYYKSKIDGNFKDWSDAIPITFETAGKETVISTYWSKRHFCIYVQVEEDKLRSYDGDAASIDAVQFTLAPKNTATPSEPTAKAQRYEFLIVDAKGLFAKDKCFCLTEPDTELSITQRPRPLEPLRLEEAMIVIKRRGKTTHYECAIPFSAMPTIKPDVGREFSLSVLVHDPDGTGIRDLGKAMGLWPEQRNRFAWCVWGSVIWSDDPPYDSKLEWGLCSSKH